MTHSNKVSERGANNVSEMVIVDTLTKLIFGEEDNYCDLELQIIQVLRQVDDNVGLDCHADMGVYLRALGVREMIGLVSRIRVGLDRGIEMKSAGRSRPANIPPPRNLRGAR